MNWATSLGPAASGPDKLAATSQLLAEQVPSPKLKLGRFRHRVAIVRPVERIKGAPLSRALHNWMDLHLGCCLAANYRLHFDEN